MCFHVSEARQFDGPRILLDCRWSTCNCPVCRVADAISSSMEQFKEARAFMHMIERMSCEDYPQYHDTFLFAKLSKDIAVGKMVSINTEAEKRVLVSVSEVHQLSVVQPGFVRSAKGKRKPDHFPQKQKDVREIVTQLPHHHVDVDYITVRTELYPYFSGKCVEFYGESPLILGKTPIVRSYATTGGADIAFVRNAASIPLALKSSEIWCPPNLTILGYVKTGKKHLHYVQWKKQNPQIPVSVPSDIITPYGIGLRAKTKLRTDNVDNLLFRYTAYFDEATAIRPELPHDVSLLYTPFKKGLLPITPQFKAVVTGTSGELEKEVEDFVYKHVKDGMERKAFDIKLSNVFNHKLKQAKKHVAYLKGAGFLKDEGTMVRSTLGAVK